MLWWKVIHIVAVISWMAGLLYLFRLFVYHNQEAEIVVKERFQTMERRLYWTIASPAGLLTLISGIALVIYTPSFLKQGWLHTKLLMVVGLVFLHIKALRLMKEIKIGKNFSNLWLRCLNEVPTLLMIVIVILVILKPF